MVVERSSDMAAAERAGRGVGPGESAGQGGRGAPRNRLRGRVLPGGAAGRRLILGRLFPGGLVLALALAALRLSAQPASLHEVERIRIGFGRENGQIGVDRGDGEEWKPLFFDVDREGRIHIPDFYKGRIAVFDRQGRLAEQKPCLEGISPRMNYFRLAPNGRYVTFGDHHLYCLRPDGALAWKREMGYGAVPSHVWANEIGIFLVLPFGDGRSLVFDYSSDRPLGRFGFQAGGEQVPLIATPGGDGPPGGRRAGSAPAGGGPGDSGEAAGVTPSGRRERFTFRLSRMRELAGGEERGDAFRLKEEAWLAGVDAENRSLWRWTKGRSENYALFSGSGALLRQGSLVIPDGLPGTGFWTVADDRMRVYKSLYLESYMEIVVYQFSEIQ